MATTQPVGSFLDTYWARLVALLIALAIVVLFVTNWQSEMSGLFASRSLDNAANLLNPSSSPAEPAKEANPALEACLNQRVGDVDRMKNEGILSDAQYGQFRASAEELCRARNAG
jgi:hypothetical protein